MIQPLDQSIIELLNASLDDEETLGLPVNDRVFGWHAQQAIEKLMKALIGGHAERYKYAHDLAELNRHLQALGETLPFPLQVVDELTSYAGVWRYQEPSAIKPERRLELQQAVADLRQHVTRRLVALRPGVAWKTLL
jgi:hypothetical protein